MKEIKTNSFSYRMAKNISSDPSKDLCDFIWEVVKGTLLFIFVVFITLSLAKNLILTSVVFLTGNGWSEVFELVGRSLVTHPIVFYFSEGVKVLLYISAALFIAEVLVTVVLPLLGLFFLFVFGVACALHCLFTMVFNLIDSKPRDEKKVKHEPSLISEYLASVKGKYCTRLTFVNPEVKSVE